VRMEFTYPPNYDDIVAAFDIKGRHGIVFTYGNVLHNPSRVHVSPDLYAHEETHVRQQAAFQGENPGGEALPCGARGWWERYIADAAFRLDQEVEAYRAQWAYAKDNMYGRKARRELLAHITKALSGPMYGRIVTAAQAKELISG